VNRGGFSATIFYLHHSRRHHPLAVLAAVPLMAAVLYGWKVMLPTFAWNGAGNAADLVSI
jgi:hypothetical protein